MYIHVLHNNRSLLSVQSLVAAPWFRKHFCIWLALSCLQDEVCKFTFSCCLNFRVLWINSGSLWWCLIKVFSCETWAGFIDAQQYPEIWFGFQAGRADSLCTSITTVIVQALCRTPECWLHCSVFPKALLNNGTHLETAVLLLLLLHSVTGTELSLGSPEKQSDAKPFPGCCHPLPVQRVPFSRGGD